jgi:uncharacterized protein (DUF433 family)
LENPYTVAIKAEVEKEMKMKRNAKLLGRYIIADPKICHGQPTFRGTRVLVADVLEQVGSGMVREAIIEEWNGNITQEAIAEAVQLAAQALLRHTDEFVLEPAAR